MGLGKTLSIISLIATNTPGALLPPVNKPGAPAAAAAAGPSGAGATAAALGAAAVEVEEGGARPAKRRKKVSAGADWIHPKGRHCGRHATDSLNLRKGTVSLKVTVVPMGCSMLGNKMGPSMLVCCLKASSMPGLDHAHGCRYYEQYEFLAKQCFIVLCYVSILLAESPARLCSFCCRLVVLLLVLVLPRAVICKLLLRPKQQQLKPLQLQ